MNEEVIDVHVHIGKDIFAEKNKLKNARGNESEQNYKELLKEMNINKIKKSLIMPFPSPAEFYSKGTWYTQENKDILDITNKEENLYGILAFHPKDYKEIEKLISIKVKGLKLHTRATSVDPKDLIRHPIMNILKKFSLPLLLHIGTGKEEELINSQKSIELPSAIELAKNEPEVIFIFAHLGRLNKSLFEGLELDNVFFDTSGLSLINKYPESFLANDTISNLPKEPSKVLELLMEKGYSNKILFGSDEPYGTSYLDELNIIKRANISEGEKIKILSLNARRVFNI